MPYRFAKAQLVRGPEPLGLVSGTEIRHLKPFFPDLLEDAQRRHKLHSIQNLDHLAAHNLLIARRLEQRGYQIVQIQDHRWLAQLPPRHRRNRNFAGSNTLPLKFPRS